MIDSIYHCFECQHCIVRVATVRENIWKTNFFPGQEKVREFCGWSGKFRKALESQGGYDRQTSENLYILFKRGKDVLSHETV